MTTILDFGKYKGYSVESVPSEYLKWLCCYDIGFSCNCTDGSVCECKVFDTLCKYDDYQGSGRNYLYENKRNIIECARKIAREKKKCLHCFKRLVPIGFSRGNGKNHDDWDTRFLHKKCWKELRYYGEQRKSETNKNVAHSSIRKMHEKKEKKPVQEM